MADGYNLSELRLVQERSQVSAANALFVNVGTCPAGKLWIVIGVSYLPSVAETQVVSFERASAVGTLLSILNPVSLNLNPATASPLEYGSTTTLLPGEYIRVNRVAATAGSTMGIAIQFVEVDLPLYDYVEPQAAARVKRAATSLVERVTRAGGGGGGGGGRPAGFRGSPARPK